MQGSLRHGGGSRFAAAAAAAVAAAAAAAEAPLGADAGASMRAPAS